MKNPAAVALGTASYKKRVKKHGKAKLHAHLKEISKKGVAARRAKLDTERLDVAQ